MPAGQAVLALQAAAAVVRQSIEVRCGANDCGGCGVIPTHQLQLPPQPPALVQHFQHLRT